MYKNTSIQKNLEVNICTLKNNNIMSECKEYYNIRPIILNYGYIKEWEQIIYDFTSPGLKSVQSFWSAISFPPN